MQSAEITSLRSLSAQSGISRRQIARLRCGKAQLLSVEHALKLAHALQLSLPELLQQFGTADAALVRPVAVPSDAVLAEYQRLEEKLAQARSQHFQEFQAEVLNILEPLLLQWPTAAYAAQKNPTAPAVRLLPLLRPLENLLRSWQIELIGEVGKLVDFDPQLHQWNDVTSPPNFADSVQVSYVGYWQGNRLLYRAKVQAAKQHQEDSERHDRPC